MESYIWCGIEPDLATCKYISLMAVLFVLFLQSQWNIYNQQSSADF